MPKDTDRNKSNTSWPVALVNALKPRHLALLVALALLLLAAVLWHGVISGFELNFPGVHLRPPPAADIEPKQVTVRIQFSEDVNVRDPQLRMVGYKKLPGGDSEPFKVISGVDPGGMWAQFKLKHDDVIYLVVEKNQQASWKTDELRLTEFRLVAYGAGN